MRTGAERAIVRMELRAGRAPARSKPRSSRRVAAAPGSTASRSRRARTWPPRPRAPSSRPRTSPSSAAGPGAPCPARRRAGPARPRRRAGGRRDRAGPAPTGGVAAPVRGAGPAETSSPPSTCGTSAWPTPARSWWRPGSAWPADLGPLVASAYGRLAGATGEPVVVATLRPQLERRPGRGPGGQPPGRPAPGGEHGRAAPRRPGPGSSTGGKPAPTPPRASSAAWLSPCASACTSWCGTRTPLRPTLLLDDVFSELDPGRSRALVAQLPEGQSLAHHGRPVPEGIAVARVVPVTDLVGA